MFATAAAALPSESSNTAAGRDVFAASRPTETDQTEKICTGFARLSHMERENLIQFSQFPKTKQNRSLSKAGSRSKGNNGADYIGVFLPFIL